MQKYRGVRAGRSPVTMHRGRVRGLIGVWTAPTIMQGPRGRQEGRYLDAVGVVSAWDARRAASDPELVMARDEAARLGEAHQGDGGQGHLVGRALKAALGVTAGVPPDVSRPASKRLCCEPQSTCAECSAEGWTSSACMEGLLGARARQPPSSPSTLAAPPRRRPPRRPTLRAAPRCTPSPRC